MLKKSILCALLGTSLLLSGCVTTSGKHEDYKYSQKFSRANNLAMAFKLGIVRETEAPKGSKVSENGSILLDSAVWTSNFHAAAGSSLLPGTGSWGAALGWGIGFGLLESSLKPLDPRTRTLLVGYVRAEDAADPKEAEVKLTSRFVEAIEKSVKAQIPDAETKIEVDQGMFVRHTKLVVRSEKLKCITGDECRLIVNSGKPSSETGMTAPALGEPFKAWRFLVPDVFLYLYWGKESTLNWMDVLAASAPYMPDNQYLYVPSILLPQSKDQRSAPFFVEKDKVDFFVIPDTPDAIFRDPKYQNWVKRLKY